MSAQGGRAVSAAHHIADIALSPLVAAAGVTMRAVRRLGLAQMPFSRRLLHRIGIFPLRNHYYEPLFDTSALRRDDMPRALPAIDLAVDRQLELLSRFTETDRLRTVPTNAVGDNGFHMANRAFEAGDAEIWFHVIRHFRPRRIIEIGSGHSTRMARLALDTLKETDPAYRCTHVCIEPYEMPWLEELDVEVVRTRLEDTDPTLFDTLAAGDILFIDSSHMIRPQGEVLLEYLQLLPRLASGVIVHVHDIFTPRDYPPAWLDEPRFWNEQYLLEAFLCHNDAWEVMLALNQLKHDRFEVLAAACPHLTRSHEPGSFYLRRR